jgi:multidrug transporter EmrE-like cation transporter
MRVPMQIRATTPTDYLYILGTVLFTVYGQIVLKWQMNRIGLLPAAASERAFVLGRLLLNPWVLSCLVAGLLALVSWMAALTRFELTYAYPFVSITFALVLLLSAVFFGESITLAKSLGVLLIILGVALGSRA